MRTSGGNAMKGKLLGGQLCLIVDRTPWLEVEASEGNWADMVGEVKN